MKKAGLQEQRSGLSVRIEGFRAFRDSGWFNLRSLTYLVGRNSSGKSSVLTALLLLKQSLEVPRRSRDVRVPLNLSGPYCDLGQYADAAYNHKGSRNIVFSFKIHFPTNAPGDWRSSRPLVDIESPGGSRLDRNAFYPRFNAKRLPKTGEVTMRLTFANARQRGPFLSEVRFELSSGPFVVLRASEGAREFSFWDVIHTNLPTGMFEVQQHFSVGVPRISRGRAYRSETERVRRPFRELENAAAFIADSVEGSLRSTDVVGPYRRPPDRHYSFGGLGVSRNGMTGEQAVTMLMAEHFLRGKRGPRPLNTAVSIWLKHLGLANEIRIQDLAKRLSLYSVTVGGTGKRASASLADVGFGVSQVLPILVQGMQMRPSGIFLVQQPELHLHPDAQAGLADFFFFLASHGIPCVVETHSEYILLRLRRRLAEGTMNFPAIAPDRQSIRAITREDVSVLLTAPAKLGGASVTELTISESFQFDSLPKGFMTQALDDRLALLSAVATND